MSSAANHLSIYFIVAVNAVCQVMLIWRLKLDKRAKWKYSAFAVATPLLITMTMRLLVATGAMHLRLAEQGSFERGITMLASVLLIATPPMATAAALLCRLNQKPEVAEGDLLKA